MEPGTRLGPYEIIAPLGAGGMGEVFRARDTRLGRSVAIKVLPAALANDERFVTRFKREAQAISQLTHPHICTLHDIGRHDDTSYLVMELLDGQSLADRLARGPMPLRDVLRYGAEIAMALDAAHRAGLVHRDLKPGNIMITKSGAKLLDFGLVRPSRAAVAVKADAETEKLSPVTAEGTIVGTLPYMSPEQLRGHELDTRSDIYSLGVVLHEMITGKRPFAATDSVSLIAQILEQEPPRVSAVQPVTPRALEHVVTSCMQKDPDARMQSAADVAHELRWIGTDPAAPEVEGPGGRRWVMPAIAGVILAALAAFAAYRFASRRPVAAAGLTFRQLTFDSGEESQPSISPDGKMFAFVKGPKNRRDIFVQRTDGRSAIDLTADSNADNSAPAFSPDGNSIAFRSERDGGGIFVVGATGESVRRLTSKGYDPAWSPDGRQIVFSEERTDDPSAVYDVPGVDVVDVASGATRLLYDGTDIMQPHWSPHGDRIAFWSVNSGQRDIYTIDSAGHRDSIRAVTSDVALDWNPMWAPDGRHLYFFSDRDGMMNLYSIAIDEHTGRTSGVPESVRLPSANAGWASIAHDGRIVYQSTTPYGELLRIRVDAANARVVPEAAALLAGSMNIRYPAQSPDGKWIAFSHHGPQEDLFIMKPDGTAMRQLTNDAARERGIRWWPDSSKIVFYSNLGGAFDAWTIRPDGSGLTRLSAIPGGADFPRISPDQRRMAFISDSERGAAIATLDGPLPVTKFELLPPPLGRRFLARQWSPNGEALVGGPYGGRGLIVYFVTARRYVTLPVDAVTATFLNDRELLYVDGQRQIGIADIETQNIRVIGHLPDDASFGFNFAAIECSPNSILAYRTRSESDVWEATPVQ